MKLPVERQTKIHFDPGPHKYYDDNGLVYTSVTTLIGGYKKPFNKRYWSMYTAIKETGATLRPDMKSEKFITINNKLFHIDELYKDPSAIKIAVKVEQEWLRKTEIACERGNNIHDSLENNINESKGDIKGETNHIIQPTHSLSGELIVLRTKHDLEKTGIQDRYPSIYLRLLKFINMGCTLFAEKRIYTIAYQVAGMIDVLIVKGKMFAILDWKTNKDELIFESGYFKKIKNTEGQWVKGNQFIRTDNRLYAPISHLPECKGMVYSLQLSLYAYIMILWGYKLASNGLEICHIRPNMEPKFIKINFLYTEIQSLLLDHYEKNVTSNSKTASHFGIS